MTLPTLAQDFPARLDSVTDNDTASQLALDSLYRATGQIERLIPDWLWEAYDGAFVDVYNAVRQSAYLAGYAAATQEAHSVHFTN